MDPGAHRPEPAPNPELALTVSRVGATGFRTLAADAGRARPPPPGTGGDRATGIYSLAVTEPLVGLPVRKEAGLPDLPARPIGSLMETRGAACRWPLHSRISEDDIERIC